VKRRSRKLRPRSPRGGKREGKPKHTYRHSQFAGEVFLDPFVLRKRRTGLRERRKDRRWRHEEEEEEEKEQEKEEEEGSGEGKKAMEA
jgi:hypothetical protein